MNQTFEVNEFRLNITVFQTFPKAIDKATKPAHQSQSFALE